MRVHAFTVCNLQYLVVLIGVKVRSKRMFNNVLQCRTITILRCMSIAAVHEAKERSALRIKFGSISAACNLLCLVGASLLANNAVREQARSHENANFIIRFA